MKALIVIDMQNDFIDGALANPMAQAIVDPICEYIKNFVGKVVITQDTHSEHYLKTNEGKHLPIEHCIFKTKGWHINSKIVHELVRKEDIAGIYKSNFGFLDRMTTDFGFCYASFNLCGYDTIEIVGVCTDICVISNALILKSIYPDANIIVHANLCAGTTKEMHECALKVMESCQIEVRR